MLSIGHQAMRAARLVALIATAALALAWFVVLRPTSLGGTAGYVLVSGPSMLPTLATDDLVITQRQDRYSVGDIVAFQVNDALVIHRIVAGGPVGGFTTRGDHNLVEDGFRATPATIVGKAWLRLPGVARWILFVRQPLPLAICTWGLTSFLLLRRWGRKPPAAHAEA